MTTQQNTPPQQRQVSMVLDLNKCLGCHTIDMYNCNEFIESVLAAFMPKAIPVNINYRYTSEELRYLFENAGLKAPVFDAALEAPAAAALDAASGFDAERALDMIVAEQINCLMIVGDAMGIPLLNALRAHPGRSAISSTRRKPPRPSP